MTVAMEERVEAAPSPNGQEAAEAIRVLSQALTPHLHARVDREEVKAMIAEAVQARAPREIAVRTPEGEARKLSHQPHAAFPELIALVNEGHKNLMMVGPAGSGKTTLAKSLAEALDLPFGFLSLSAGITETHLMGRTMPQPDGSWAYQPSRFVTIYERGGVFLLDEVDAGDANVMVSVNAALANGHLANPQGGMHERHANTIIIAAANTWGRGGDLQYVGRNQLDAATLDRFVLATCWIDYDSSLEAEIVAPLGEEVGRELLDWIGNLRQDISRHRLRRVASTRLVVSAAMAMLAGRSLDQVQDRYFRDWSTDERAKVGGAA